MQYRHKLVSAKERKLVSDKVSLVQLVEFVDKKVLLVELV